MDRCLCEYLSMQLLYVRLTCCLFMTSVVYIFAGNVSLCVGYDMCPDGMSGDGSGIRALAKSGRSGSCWRVLVGRGNRQRVTVVHEIGLLVQVIWLSTSPLKQDLLHAQVDRLGPM
jgi:hypothetical protein